MFVPSGGLFGGFCGVLITNCGVGTVKIFDYLWGGFGGFGWRFSRSVDGLAEIRVMCLFDFPFPEPTARLRAALADLLDLCDMVSFLYRLGVFLLEVGILAMLLAWERR